MGCDIHFYVEKFVNNKWSAVKTPKELSSGEKTLQWRISRNYLLFGILAGVRSNYIDPPFPVRGIPADSSQLILKQFKKREGDAHSKSYLYLNELLELENLFVRKEVYLNAYQYKQFIEFKKITDYETFVYNEKNLISTEEMLKLSNLLIFSNDDNDLSKMTAITTELPISSFIQIFWDNYIPVLKKIHKDTSKVRCVFWFDN